MLLTIVAIAACAGRAGAQAFEYDAAGRLGAAVFGGGARIDYRYQLDDSLTNIVIAGTQAEADTDTDGLPDAWEWVFFNVLTNGPTGDPNQNGKDNLWEFQNGYDPLDPDSDGDGSPNADELAAGTDPLDPDSSLALMDVRFQPSSGFVLSWQSVSGKTYRVGRISSLVTGEWSWITAPIAATQPLTVRTDSTAIGPGPWLYRIHLE
ncbi:MAG: hypothetical protein EOM72_01675 [Opitutae bacterium]|nr:hypothetical protein [Opitutae bacterium]